VKTELALAQKRRATWLFEARSRWSKRTEWKGPFRIGVTIRRVRQQLSAAGVRVRSQFILPSSRQDLPR
jgi:hypothetical protein